MHSKFFSWLALVGFVVALTGAVQAADQPNGNITAKRVKGTVLQAPRNAPNNKTPVTEGLALTPATIVTTQGNSSIVLVFSNGASINLAQNTELDIETFTQDPFAENVDASTMTIEPTHSKTVVNLTRGELVGKVAKLDTAGGSTFTVGTPVGAAGIRGTTFRIRYVPDGNGRNNFTLTTLEGNVEITLATGNIPAPVSVTNNQEIVLNSVEINVSATGQITVVTATGATITVPNVVVASGASQAAVAAAAQEIAAAVANTVLSSSGSTTNQGNTNQQQENTNAVSNPTQGNSTLTPGAGG